MTDEVGVLTMFSVNAGTLFRGASFSRIGHVTQSVTQSQMFLTNNKSGRQGWVKLGIKPFNYGKYGLPWSSMVPIGPVWSRMVLYVQY